MPGITIVLPLEQRNSQRPIFIEMDVERSGSSAKRYGVQFPARFGIRLDFHVGMETESAVFSARSGS